MVEAPCVVADDEDSRVAVVVVAMKGGLACEVAGMGAVLGVACAEGPFVRKPMTGAGAPADGGATEDALEVLSCLLADNDLRRSGDLPATSARTFALSAAALREDAVVWRYENGEVGRALLLVGHGSLLIVDFVGRSPAALSVLVGNELTEAAGLTAGRKGTAAADTVGLTFLEADSLLTDVEGPASGIE